MYLVRVVTIVLFLIVGGCSAGGAPSAIPVRQVPALPAGTTPSSGTVISSAPAPATVHFSFVPAPQQTAGGITIGSDGFVYLNGATAFLKYNGSGFTSYPYVLSSGQTQMFVPVSALRNGPGNTVWTATDQCCDPPTGYDFQFFEVLSTSGSVAVTQLVTTTHFGAGIVSFSEGADAIVWSAIQCAPPVCGTGQLSLVDASGSVFGGPPIPAGDQLGPIANGSDGSMYLVDYTSSTMLRIDVHTHTIAGSLALPPGVQAGAITDLTNGPDGALWFTDSPANTIGRLKLDGTFKSFSIPTSNAGPSSIAAASDNALWFTETTTGKIGRIALDGTFTEYPIPNGTAPIGITAGAPSCAPGTVYFTQPSSLGILTF